MDFARTHYDLIGRSKIWYTISIILVSISLIAMIKNMVTIGFPFVRGIDFTGGSIIALRYDDWDSSKDIPQFIQEVKILVGKYSEKSPEAQVTRLTAEETESGKPGLLIQIRADKSLIANQDAQKNLFDELRGVAGDFEVVELSEVGAIVGKELAYNAILGVAIGLFLILIYIAVRVSLDFSICAIIALFHDLIILCGVYAVFNIEINSPFVAVLLTVVGYSINDTIIIYDRIRENLKVKKHLPFDTLVNVSLLETMMRSINTIGTTVAAIVALLIFGGMSIRTFMVGLGIGILVGGYSSIFVAAPLIVSWRMRGKKAVRITEPALDARSIVLEDDEEEAMTPGASAEVSEAEVEPITISGTPAQAAARRKAPKRRKRRH